MTESQLVNLYNRLVILERDMAVQGVRDEHLEKRLVNIEDSLKRIYNLGWWILSVFGGALILAVTSFIFKGGLAVAI